MLFLVTVSGEGIKLHMENASPIDAGFIKNEVVLAISPNQAASQAVETVTARLRKQASEGGLLIDALSIHVDDTLPTFRFWKLLLPDGFVFYPKEES